jgi:hypothetical protein
VTASRHPEAVDFTFRIAPATARLPAPIPHRPQRANPRTGHSTPARAQYRTGHSTPAGAYPSRAPGHPPHGAAPQSDGLRPSAAQPDAAGLTRPRSKCSSGPELSPEPPATRGGGSRCSSSEVWVRHCCYLPVARSGTPRAASVD